MDPICLISEDLILLDWGPMTMSVSVWASGKARPVMATLAARQGLKNLVVLADFQKLLKKLPSELPPNRPLPSVVSRAVDAVRLISAELTPLAAVAGAAADEVALAAVEQGADRVMVNNGGDIALRLTGNQEAVVGIKPPKAEELTAELNIRAGDGIGGVATSGWQGRSFSTGLADLVCVWAASGAIADAAATYLAGKCDVAGAAVEKAPANQLNPGTDLGEMEVTTAVGRLSAEEKSQALAAARQAAEDLLNRELINGCLIQVQGDSLALDPLSLLSF